MLEERWPVNKSPQKCDSEESSFLFELERQALGSTEPLDFDILKKDIEEDHHERLSNIWETVLICKTEFLSAVAALKQHWIDAPKNPGFPGAYPQQLEFDFPPIKYKNLHSPQNTPTQPDLPFHPDPKEHTPSNPDSTKVHKKRISHTEANLSLRKKPTDNSNLYFNFLSTPHEQVRLSELANTIIEIRSLVRKRISQEYQNGVFASLDVLKIRKSEDLQTWRTTDKSLRRMTYEAQKNYITALRLYLAMLLESSDDKTAYIFPKNHPLRKHLVHRLRALEAIHATHQGISAAKTTLHHGSTKKSRIRKIEKKAAVEHMSNTTANTIFDVLPYSTDKQDQLTIDLVVLTVLTAIHDIVEDTDQDTEEVIQNYIKPFIDKYDSKLDPRIKSGFPERTRQEVKAKVLDLLGLRSEAKIKHSRRSALKSLLRIISNNTELERTQKPSQKKRIEAKNAITQNIAGFETTAKILKPTEEELGTWGIQPENLQTPSSKTFRTFPEKDHSHDKHKLTKFLIRLNAIAAQSKKIQQIALIVKIEDRANNLESLEGFNLDLRLNTIRTTVTRLIAWCMLDHDNKNYPLYNAIPRLIDNTLVAYSRLEQQHPEKLNNWDRVYITQLERWQREVIRHKTVNSVKELLAS